MMILVHSLEIDGFFPANRNDHTDSSDLPTVGHFRENNARQILFTECRLTFNVPLFFRNCENIVSRDSDERSDLLASVTMTL
mgnify:CR=1 FL=1